MKPRTSANSTRFGTIEKKGSSFRGKAVGKPKEEKPSPFRRLSGEKRILDSRTNTFVTARSICSVIAECRACEILDEDYKEQVSFKTSHLSKLFASLPNVRSLPCVESEEKTSYRHSAKLVCEEKVEVLRPGEAPKQWIKIGLYQPGSHQLIDIKSCPVQAHLMNKICGFLRRELKESGVSVYDPKKLTGDLRYVIIRQSRNLQTALVTFVVRKDIKPVLRNFARQMAQEFSGRVEGVLMHVNNTSGNSIFDFDAAASLELLTGVSHLTDKIAGVDLRYSAQSFMQVNPAVAEKIYFRIEEILGLSKDKNVLDVYCGVGTIGLLLAKSARNVVGVEENIHAVSDAIYNAEKNKLKNIEFVSGNASEVIHKVISEKNALNTATRENYFDVVCVNPPRKGCSEDVLSAIAAAQPQNIVYMSCNAETLKRDVEFLIQKGFNAQFVEPFDMFPGTKHYEVLCLLKRN